ncbi:uncharacterized protein [Leptinotarsa decemlineata]|uniref:uncharacterized protein n=1 Tax=Leptinotarsa decemlineata TaxID=7539 RepID=UPI003D30C383
MDNTDINGELYILDLSEFISHPSNTRSVSLQGQYLQSGPSQPVSVVNDIGKHIGKDEMNHHWSKDHSLILIDCYKMFRHKVGGMEIRNLKKMWEIIANYIYHKYKLKYSAGNCENRWRVLERNYKKYIENNSKTGRGRRYFEFAEEMDAIFQKKRSINPEILLSSSGVITPRKITANKENLADTQNEIKNMELDLVDGEGLTTINEKRPKTSVNCTPQKIKTRIHAPKYKKDSILQQIRIDRKQYQDERIKLEKLKIEEMLKLEKEKLEIRKKRNELLETRNILLGQMSKNKNSDVEFNMLV